MNLDRTVKWIDKTGTHGNIQTEEINFVKLSNTLADCSNIASNFKGTKMQLRNFNLFLVSIDKLR